MRFALVATLAAALMPGAYAQRAVSPPMVNNSNILHPGIPPSGAPGAFPRTNFRGGRRPYGGGAVLVPYPAYVDPFYSGYGVGYGPGPVGYDPASSGYAGYDPQAPAPTIIINQNFQPDTLHPQFRDYSNVPLPEPGVTIPAPSAPGAGPAPAAAGPRSIGAGPGPADDETPNLFLIALKDQSVLAAVAYWVQDDTLNYVTLKGAQNHVSLSLVDRDLSRRLNDERQVQFKLPAPR